MLRLFCTQLNFPSLVSVVPPISTLFGHRPGNLWISTRPIWCASQPSQQARPRWLSHPRAHVTAPNGTQSLWPLQPSTARVWPATGARLGVSAVPANADEFACAPDAASASPRPAAAPPPITARACASRPAPHDFGGAPGQLQHANANGAQRTPAGGRAPYRIMRRNPRPARSRGAGSTESGRADEVVCSRGADSAGWRGQGERSAAGEGRR